MEKPMVPLNLRNWQILFSQFSGLEQKAVTLVSKEMGRWLNRDPGVFTLHVMPCRPWREETLPETEDHLVILGTYEESALIRRYVAESEIPEDGYVVRVMDDPENADRKLALLTGRTAQNVFYAAVDFVDDFFAAAAPMHGGAHMVNEIFGRKVPDYFRASAPKVKTRSIFTWGQPINDYRSYFDNMARLKLNQIIIWNDFLPINAADVVAYAHSYGIEVLWGFAWGWSTNHCRDNHAIIHLDELKASILERYEREYAHVPGDGIYFQSFTETDQERIDGILIAEAVTKLVNETSGELFRRHPGLHIQFGLHATSVRERLQYFEAIDPRVEILWEDCGAYPYAYHPEVQPEEFEETREFTKKIMQLRGMQGVGLVMKGMMTMDWSRFAHQRGPYVLGEEAGEIVQHDRELLRPLWRFYQGDWIRNGDYARRLILEAGTAAGGNLNFCIAATLLGGIWLPEALCAEMFWNADEDFAAILERVSRRHSVTMA